MIKVHPESGENQPEPIVVAHATSRECITCHKAPAATAEGECAECDKKSS